MPARAGGCGCGAAGRRAGAAGPTPHTPTCPTTRVRSGPWPHGRPRKRCLPVLPLHRQCVLPPEDGGGRAGHGGRPSDGYTRAHTHYAHTHARTRTRTRMHVRVRVVVVLLTAAHWVSAARAGQCIVCYKLAHHFHLAVTFNYGVCDNPLSGL